MITNFDISRLNALLKDFYNLTKIRITVFNEEFVELASYPENLAPCCRIIRSDTTGLVRCKECDKEACRRAARHHSLYTYRCHAGLTESITPLYLGNIIVGYLLFGHVFAYASHEEGWNVIQQNCKDYSLDMEALKKACLAMPIHSEDYITSASHILEAVASYLCLEYMSYFRHQKLPVQIDEYINAHFTEDITAMDIARQFEIGKTRLYEISKRNYGVGIAEHLRNLRIEKAKTLLLNEELPLTEIAMKCGFKDYNYFITIFRQKVGIPPKRYQKLCSD